MSIESIWPLMRLDNLICDMQPGFARRPNIDNSGCPQLRTNNISDEGCIDLSLLKYVDASASEREKYGIKPGDVIFNNTNSPVLVGKTALFGLDEEYLISNHMTRLRVDNTLLIAPFLARYLHYLWMIGYSQSRAKQWVNQAAIDQRQLSRFLIPLPPLSEQRRIVDILCQADDLRRLRREADTRMEDLQASMFYEMFGDPNPHQNDRGWDSVKLGDVFDVGTGGTPSRAKSEYFGGEYPWVKSTELQSNFILEAEESLTKAGLSSSNARIYPANTVLVAMYGQGKTRGMTAKLGITASVNQAIAAFPPSDVLLPDYVWHWFQVSYERIRSLGRGGPQRNLNLTILKRLRVPKPDKDTQEAFMKIVEKIRVLNVSQRSSIEKLDNLLNSLLARAFAGELTAAWREQNAELLQEEATQRELALGLQPHKRGIDFASELDTPGGEQAFDQQIQEILQPAVGQLVEAVTPKVRLGDILKIEPLVRLNQLVSPVLSAYRTTVNASLLRGVEQLSKAAQESLAGSVKSMQALAQSAVGAHQQQIVDLAGQIVQMAALITRCPDEDHPRYHSLRALSDEQHGVYLAALLSDGYFTAESLLDEDDLPVDNVRRTLALLEALGLVARVSVPTIPTGAGLFYVPAYRVPVPDDDSRDDDLATLEAAFPGLAA